jgi:hypothetical protein
MRKCIALDAARASVVDSYISECHSTFDAQAIAGTNGPGPFKIVNNYLEASGENINWGGADPGIPGLVPADIEIRRNHIFKQLSWKGTRWVEKNMIESKNSTRLVGATSRNSWVADKRLHARALSVNQNGRCTVRDQSLDLPKQLDEEPERRDNLTPSSPRPVSTADAPHLDCEQRVARSHWQQHVPAGHDSVCDHRHNTAINPGTLHLCSAPRRRRQNQ